MNDKSQIFENLQVNIDDLPSTGQIGYEGLQKKYLSIMLISSSFFYLLIVMGFLLAWYLNENDIFRDIFQWLLMGTLLVYLANLYLIYKVFEFRGFAYRKHDISYKSGWLWRSTTTVPFNRVQHCEVSQSVLDRYFGLAKLKIFTAGGSASDVSIPGLKIAVANDLKHFILDKVKEDEY